MKPIQTFTDVVIVMRVFLDQVLFVHCCCLYLLKVPEDQTARHLLCLLSDHSNPAEKMTNKNHFT